MYVIDPDVKRDPVRRWALPDRVFFAAGACHILAHAVATTWKGYIPIWIRPRPGFTGNHIVMKHDLRAFDYHGHTCLNTLLNHTIQKARRWWPRWACDLVPLPVPALTDPSYSADFEGLHLRPPQDFLHDPIPRAARFLSRFDPPPAP